MTALAIEPMRRVQPIGSWIAWSSLAVALFAAFNLVAVHTGRRRISYSATSGWLEAVTVVAGFTLIAVAAVLTILKVRGSVGSLLSLLALTWFAADWVGRQDGPEVIRSVGMFVVPLTIPVLAHLAALDTEGILRPRGTRALVIVVFAVTVTLAVTITLVRDPFRDPSCWNDCGATTLRVLDSPALARRLSLLAMWWAFAVGFFIVIASIVRLTQATSATRRRLAPLVVPVMITAVMIAVHALCRVFEPVERPADVHWAAIYVVTAGGLAAIALGESWRLTDDLRRRRSVRRLTDELARTSDGGSLCTALARSLGDPDLEIAYRMTDRSGHVNDTGRPTDAVPHANQTAVPIERNGERVAVVLVSRSAAAMHDLEAEIGSAARLAIDNERLRAQALHQLDDLRSSRRRVVDTADRHRRELERDLHDGTQQRLLALAYQIRLAREDTDPTDTDLLDMWTQAEHLVAVALAELRELANGLYPVILHEAGLRDALATFADDAPIRVLVAGVPPGRLPDATETAAYRTVTATSTDAAHRAATSISVQFRQRGDSIEIRLRDDGRVRDGDELVDLRDRVAAIGGSLDVDLNDVVAVIRCA